MESRIAVISIIVENSDSVECLNRILHDILLCIITEILQIFMDFLPAVHRVNAYILRKTYRWSCLHVMDWIKCHPLYK